MGPSSSRTSASGARAGPPGSRDPACGATAGAGRRPGPAPARPARERVQRRSRRALDPAAGSALFRVTGARLGGGTRNLAVAVASGVRGSSPSEAGASEATMSAPVTADSSARACPRPPWPAPQRRRRPGRCPNRPRRCAGACAVRSRQSRVPARPGFCSSGSRGGALLVACGMCGSGQLAGSAAGVSASSSALRATASSVAVSPRFIRRTPFVCRPAFRTSRAEVRITPPVEVIAYSSSSRPTMSAPTSVPRLRSYWRVSTPLPPRPCTG